MSAATMYVWQAKRRTLCRWFGHKLDGCKPLHLCVRCHASAGAQCPRCQDWINRVLAAGTSPVVRRPRRPGQVG